MNVLRVCESIRIEEITGVDLLTANNIKSKDFIEVCKEPLWLHLSEIIYNLC